MNIFKNRPLFMILSFMMLGFVLFSFVQFNAKVFLLLLPILGLIIDFILHQNHIRPFAALFAGLMIATFLLSDFYFGFYYSPEQRFGDSAEIEGVVEKISYNEVYGGRVILNVKSVNGKHRASFKTELEFQDVDVKDIEIGDRISTHVNFTDLSPTDADQVYEYSTGISSISVSAEDYILLSKDNKTYFIRRTRLLNTIENYIRSITDKDSAALLSAVMLGDRSDLAPELKLDFTRIGISHLLALSGLHLSVISFLLCTLLSLFKIGKKTKLSFNIVFVFLFMLLTGFTPSIVRAGSMLIVLSLCYLFGLGNDKPTVLCLTVFILILITPYAAYSLSLWLSVFSTLGLLTFPELFTLKNTGKSKVLIRMLSRLCIGFTVLGFTASLTFNNFESVSLLSPVTTPVFGLLIEIYLIVGILMLILGKLLPGGRLLSLCYSGIGYLSRKISDWKMISVGTNSRFTIVLSLVFSVALILFLIANVKKKRAAIAVLAVLFCLTYISAFTATVNTTNRENVIYSEDGKNESFLLTGNGKTAFIDISRGDYDRTRSELKGIFSQNVTEIDSFVYTYYNAKTPISFAQIASKIKIRTLSVPAPQNDEETKFYEQLTAIADKYGIQTETYSENEEIALASSILRPVYLPDRTVGPTPILEIGTSEQRISYYAKGSLTALTYDTFCESLNRSDIAVFGCRGLTPDNTYYLPLNDNPPKIMVHSSVFAVFDNIELENYIKSGGKMVFSPSEISLLNVE